MYTSRSHITNRPLRSTIHILVYIVRNKDGEKVEKKPAFFFKLINRRPIIVNPPARVPYVTAMAPYAVVAVAAVVAVGAATYYRQSSR